MRGKGLRGMTGKPMATLRLRYVHEYVDRNGAVRRYFRRRGSPSISLPGLPGSREFNAAYEAALDAEPPPKAGKGGPGSLSDLVADYFRSPSFGNLARSSQATYRKVLDPILEKDGHRLARDLPHDKAMKIIVEIGETRPGMANLTKSVLHTVYKFARITPNPFDHIDDYRLGKHHTWTDAEIAAYEARWPLGTRERLAYAVLLYTGQRVGDAVQISRADIKSGMIRVLQEKTAEDDDDVLWIAMAPALVRAIQAGPVRGLRLIGDRNGAPIKKAALSGIIRRAVADAGLPPRCVAHGLRKAALRRLAENGATTKEIAAVSGHRTLAEIERYTERASRAKLSRSAIARLPDEK
jgi:enterobacteria phage integrase